MGLIKFTNKGDFSRTERFFNSLLRRDYLNVLQKYGREGVEALRAATPKDTGLTANSWNYSLTYDSGKTIIGWYNTNVNDGVNVAVILQYGHGTKSGVYVQGRDYINPAVQPIFDKIADNVWKEVKAL